MRRKYVTTLVVFLTIVFGLLATVIALGYSPKLGLDLQGGASVVLRPVDDGAPSDAIDQSVEIIRQRVDGLGVAEPEITRQGDTIVVDLPGIEDQAQAVQIVGQTAVLRFRPVLSGPITPDQLEAASTTTLPATTVPGATTTPTTGSATTTPTTAPATTTATSAAPSPGRSRALPGQTDTTTTTPATTSATTSASPATTIPTTSTTVDPLQVDCFTARDADIPDEPAVLPQCTNDFEVEALYYLGPAFLEGDAVQTADAEFSEQSGWTVRLTLEPGAAGIDTFNEWAQKCFEGTSECPAGQRPTGAIAITLDGVVQSAPAIQPDQAVFSSFERDRIIISGGFTQGEAEDLELVLRYGALPVELTREAVQTVSATLGKDSLRAGIIAGAVGVGLVVLLMLLYYRSLALVVLAGLGVSGAIIWTVISFLGETQGLALTLAGATGIIVSVGVTVDSYVVYFERMKDDVRAGRSFRSAAQKGFKQAWRTILAADIVSLIGAFILWYFTVGSVRGFAFFLGLSTIVDMIVAYFFTRPTVGLLSTTRWFSGTEHVLGVDAGEALVTVGGTR
jgi:preprotein translocase subunit SecD